MDGILLHRRSAAYWIMMLHSIITNFIFSASSRRRLKGSKKRSSLACILTHLLRISCGRDTTSVSAYALALPASCELTRLRQLTQYHLNIHPVLSEQFRQVVRAAGATGG